MSRAAAAVLCLGSAGHRGSEKLRRPCEWVSNLPRETLAHHLQFPSEIVGGGGQLALCSSSSEGSVVCRVTDYGGGRGGLWVTRAREHAWAACPL